MYCFLNYFFDVDVGAVTWIMLEHWLTSLKFVGIVGRFIWQWVAYYLFDEMFESM